MAIKHIELPVTKQGIKRKHQPVNNNVVNNKKIKPTAYDHDAEDRLTNLPESMKLHILSFLNPKQVVQTSALSKSWVSLWTSTTDLNLYSCTTKLSDFDKIVKKVLSSRDKSVNLNKLTFNRSGSSSAMVLKTVFGYALSNGVKEVKSWITKSRNGSWPNCLHNTSSDSLTRLKLQSNTRISCKFLGQTSTGLFKNLKNLYLQKATVTDPDPFSGFPALEKLTLYNCCYEDDYTLNIRASQLYVLTIRRSQSFNRCELSTPKLRIFKFSGCCTFPMFVMPQPLLLLDAVEFRGCFYDPKVKKQSFENLVRLFGSVYNIKSLTVSTSIVQLLSGFQEELVKQCSPFQGLKILKLVQGEIPDDVKEYLLQYSNDAKVITVENKCTC